MAMGVTPPRLLIHRITIITSGESVLEVLVFLTEDNFAVGRVTPPDTGCASVELWRV